jgi:hypothetical protein
MQWFNSFALPENWKLQAIAYAVIAILAIVALTIAYRALFAHRLRLPGGGRARQSRLGLVDAFSLDGQRQLVLVRRDNVEHLVMIGGPNDVVIESQIIRVHAQPAPARDKEAAPLQNAIPPKIVAAASPPVAPIPAPSPPLAPAPAPPARPQPRPEPPNIAAQTRVAPKAPEPVAAAKLIPRPAMPPPMPAQAPTPPAPIKTSSLPPPIVVASPLPPAAQAAPQKVAVNSEAAPAPKGPSPEPPPKASAAEPPKPAAPSPRAADPFADLDTLEAEMAKLLGRKT